MTNWLAAGAICVLVTLPGQALAQVSAPAPAAGAAQPEPRDSIKDGAGRGALAGAAGMLALWGAAAKSCGIGCERSGGAALTTLVAIYGAGIGSLIGLAADLDAGPTDAPGFRAGPVYVRSTFRSSLLDGSAASPGFAAAVQLAPHISVHVEYIATDGQFRPASGTVPDDVVQHVVPAASRAAGRLEWIESRRVSYVLSQLVGLHPRPFGRLRVEFLAGLGVQGQDNRNYYEAALPGTYHVLDFKTPEIGLVLGLDAEVAITRHVAIVPMFRFNQMGDPGPSLTWGAGAHWRF